MPVIIPLQHSRVSNHEAVAWAFEELSDTLT
jgi:hypothetical protein